MNRPKYKALYQAEQARSQELKEKLDSERLQLRRIRRVLADHAERVIVPNLKELPSSGDAIPLEPLAYESYEAWLVTNMRYGYREGAAFVGPRNLAWRARRIVPTREV